MARQRDPLSLFEPPVATWFARAFPDGPTPPQSRGWPVVARGESMLLLAPTGSGKTLAAFLWCINRLMFETVPPASDRCRVLYLSPLKALAVDIERNLRAPIAGITQVATDLGIPHRVPSLMVRTGDTPASERSRFKREPADILITTPESLYLLLTSASREALRAIDTIIVDEIHALVPTKRGAHLALSIERLEAIVRRPLQRLGLSATQRPLDEVARFLGGALSSARGTDTPVSTPDATVTLHDEFRTGTDVAWRPVTVVDAGRRKQLALTLELPAEDLARLEPPIDLPSGPAARGPVRPSMWTALHPRLLDLVRAHQTTLVFVNSRRVAERLAAALNELAGEPLVRAHHGSLARPQRVEIEDALKAGRLRGLVATSSLELGIDMGAVDLVVQIEAPPSVASGLQRIGRAGHHVQATSRGVIVPKFRGDLVACAAATRAMREGLVEATRYPRNPLDVLAQQVVAMTSMDDWQADDLLAVVRRAAPFAELSRALFEGTLDMLAGRYPSDDFAELRPRVTWDRLSGRLAGREGARRVAVVNGGTIPDRGLYGVFLGGADRGAARVGELDEEMVFESRVGETFVLGASTWRIEDISHDRVLVSPAPGEPGKMPFWKGETAGRPLEFGRAIGALVRTLEQLPVTAARERLVRDHDLAPAAAETLVAYLREQKAETGVLPDDRTVVIERCRDELGDWRVCLLSPLGGRVLAPWAMAVAGRLREERDLPVETMWTDEGFVVRFPETDDPPDPGWMLPDAANVERLVVGQLSSTTLFAAKFRECAARALLLPRRRPGQRRPLWQQRKRAADLLSVASRFGSFPILLETYRECLRDLFDMPALAAILRDVGTRHLRVVTVDRTTPSPFAASLLFGYVANYLYDGDAPLPERRAQALTIDQAQLADLIGEAQLRELLDADAMADVEAQLQHLDERYRVKSADGLHDLLLRIGDLSADEIGRRAADGSGAAWRRALVTSRRAIEVQVAGEARVVAVEDASRYRDALGVPLPPGLPTSLVEPVADPAGDLALRYARTHGPFTAADLAARFGIGRPSVERLLHRLAAAGRLLEGEFCPGGTNREWCDRQVLATIRRRSIARLRHEIEPVDPATLGRFLGAWHGTTRRRRGLDALLDVVEQLQGAPLAASLVESAILPARLDDFTAESLDLLLAAGEVVWVGVEPLGDRDGRLALFLTDQLPRLWRPPTAAPDPSPRQQALLAHLATAGASFFAPLHEAAGGGYPGETVDALWTLVWRGLVTSDAFHALRAWLAPPERRRRPAAGEGYRSRRVAPPAAQGRWSLVTARSGTTASMTTWSAAAAEQLLARHGVVTREVVAQESVPGGFSAVYEVLRTLDERGHVRRGYFAAGVGALQFARPAALDLLRSLRGEPEAAEVVVLAATDPANPYGSLLKWPTELLAVSGRGPTRSVGANVVIVNGALAAWIGRHGRPVLVALPESEPDRSRVGHAIASVLADLALTGDRREGGLLVAEINGLPATGHPLARWLVDAGFVASALGFQRRRPVHDAARPRAGAHA